MVDLLFVVDLFDNLGDGLGIGCVLAFCSV